MRDLVWDLTGMRSDDVAFLSAPVSRLGWEGDQSVVYLDRAAGEASRAVREDRPAGWATEQPEVRTPPSSSE